MASDREDKGNNKAWTASEMLSQKEEEASSESESDMGWFSQSEGDRECPTKDSDDNDDEDDDEDGWKAVSPEEELGEFNRPPRYPLLLDPSVWGLGRISGVYSGAADRQRSASASLGEGDF